MVRSKCRIPGSLCVLLGVALIGGDPLAAAGSTIYESVALGPLAPGGDPAPVVVADQFVGVKFHVSAPVRIGSIGGFFAPYAVGVEADIVGAVVRLDGPNDFPDSFDLSTGDVLGKTLIHVAEPAADCSGDLAVTLTEGWYALVFAATGIQDRHNAIMPRMEAALEYPLYFFARTLDPNTPEWFAFFDGGGLDGVRMFLVTDPAPPPVKSPAIVPGPGLGRVGSAFGVGNLVISRLGTSGVPPATQER